MRSISQTSVRMLMEESTNPDKVQGYAYHAMCWLEENELENNEVNVREFSNVFRKEVSKRMYDKFKENA